MNWFKYAAILITVIYMGVLVLVIFVAYGRPSGNTGLDMAEVQKIRFSNAEARH